MTAVWPGTLPGGSLLSSFQRTQRGSIVEFPTEVGEGKRRSRSSLDMADMPFSVVMDDGQLEAFETFHKSELRKGALPFEWQEPKTMKVWRLLIGDGGGYAVTPYGSKWLVTFAVTGRVV